MFLFENSSDILKCFVKIWPKSPTGLHRSLNIQLDKFKQFVVCPSCHCIYDYDHCITATKQVQKCQFIAFPNHPRRSKRSPCGTPLLDRKKTQNGYVFSPWKVYCYQSLVASIETLLCRPGFADQCEYWRKRLSSDCSEEYLGDIYDGKVWKEFQHYEGKPFLAVPNNLALSLNVDWFSPLNIQKIV